MEEKREVPFAQYAEEMAKSIVESFNANTWTDEEKVSGVIMALNSAYQEGFGVGLDVASKFSATAQKAK